jgi:AcrR family transcriptional regulator
MGISSRKQKEKEDLTKSILKAARELFIEKGYDETSIRNIAQRIEYSPTTIYLYFKDKDAIFYALHSEGFGLLNSRMMVLQHVSEPSERLKAMGRIYLGFAMENPELYDLMFTLKAPMNVVNSEEHTNWQEGKTAFGLLQMTVADCINVGYLTFTNVEAASFLIWSAMHGMITLYTRQRCKVISDENVDTIIEKGYEQLVQMFDVMKKSV